jgi:hypothetical protein
MFGKTNFLHATAHYLRHGSQELWRETGGPPRIDIFNPLVFDWQWYVTNNPGLADAGVNTVELAKFHWRVFGLDHGESAARALAFAR